MSVVDSAWQALTETAAAAPSKTQRRNAKKRAKDKDKAGDDKTPPADAPLEQSYKQIFELSRHIVARRMQLGGEDALDEAEWQEVWPLMPTIVHALHRTVQARRKLAEKDEKIVDWELRWIGQDEFSSELKKDPNESPLSKGEATMPPSLGTAQRPHGIRGSGRPIGGPSIPVAKHSGTESPELQACPDVDGPDEHRDSSSGSEKLKGLWQLAQGQAASRALQAPGSMSEENIHQITVDIFRKLKKKAKSREKAQSKRQGFGSTSSMVAEV